MKRSVKEHYDKHLAHFYSWMVGDFTGKHAVSTYQKLILPPGQVLHQLKEAGLKVIMVDVTGGVVKIIAAKPATPTTNHVIL